MGEARHDRGACQPGVGLNERAMQRSRPPFRADQVGSLLRPAAVKAVRAQRAAGAITAAELTAVEDREIARVIARQEEVGLQAVTDGEFRRSWWHLDFLAGLDGAKLVDLRRASSSAACRPGPRAYASPESSASPAIR